MAFDLGRRNKNGLLSNKWLYAFLKRWKSEISSMKPRQLESYRAKCATPEAVQAYFNNLKAVMFENNLLGKPQHIYNLDELKAAINRLAKVINDNYHRLCECSGKCSTSVLCI